MHLKICYFCKFVKIFAHILSYLKCSFVFEIVGPHCLVDAGFISSSNLGASGIVFVDSKRQLGACFGILSSRRRPCLVKRLPFEKHACLQRKDC